MKLLRYGPPGQEKPGLLDAGGNLRDLSGLLDDFTPRTLAPEALDVLRAIEAHPWPGNIRELKSVVRRACVLAQDEWITLKDINLPVEIKPSDDYRLDMERTELEAIVKALETTGNDRKAAARNDSEPFRDNGRRAQQL